MKRMRKQSCQELQYQGHGPEKDSKSKKHLKELRLLRIQICYRNQLAVRKTMLLEREQERVHDFEDNGFQHSKQYTVGLYNRAMIQTE